MSSPRPERVDLLALGGVGELPSHDPVLLRIQPDSREGRDPGQWGGRPDPQSGADDLAGLSPSSRYDPSASPHIAPPPDGWGDDDWPSEEDAEDRGTPGTCWVCGYDFEHSITDFEPDGPHSACEATARRMDAGLQEQRRRQSATAATATATGEYFDAWTVQW